MFSASPKGASASAAVYSIVETSKANDLEPFRYLTYLLEKLPNINFKIHPEVLKDFLPWSKEVQQKYK
ncbi:transposase domain-containing protein [Selenomonas ruminantium]|uniref:transposase domain-containing protein n=1 Tax=Selenomonas ruminantium TaxID=971 RepID=UPI00350E33E2